MVIQMYDNIRLIMSEPFRSEAERNGFISRFALFVKDDKKGVYHNKGYETLEQNKGVYLRLELGGGLGRGRLTLCFSLHKFYNAMEIGKLFNYNTFGFDKANKAYRMLSGLLGLDLSAAVVKKYEMGINLQTPMPPESYMRELDCIRVKGYSYRIMEDLHYKEYKQYSTNKEKGKRIVYIFYNKTFEARSKLKNEVRKKEVPENLLRIEMDVQRPSEKILFGQLFEPDYQRMLKRGFYQRFAMDLKYKESPVKQAGISSKQMDLCLMLREKGESGTKEYYTGLYGRKVITRRQYGYILSLLNEIREKSITTSTVISPESVYLSEQIRLILT